MSMTPVHEAIQTHEPADAATRFFTEVGRICDGDPWISPLGGGILAGVTLDIAHNSRAFSRALGIEHALVIREVGVLADLGRLTVNKRNERSHSCSYELVPRQEEVAPRRRVESARNRRALAPDIIATTGGDAGGQVRSGCGGKGSHNPCRSSASQGDGAASVPHLS
jgi:hypothetical protein